MPKISVIVPVYKVEAYLKRCVDSILSQTFTDFEIILVDDGSPDGSPEICDQYAQKDTRIHVIHQENGGISAARNAGIDWAMAHSDSEWLCFVDSDDYIHREYLQFLYRAVTEQNTKIALCGFTQEVEIFCRQENNRYQAYKEAFLPVFLETEIDLYVFGAWNKLYAKELFIEHRYPVGRLREDAFFTHKLLYGNELAIVPLPLYFYYINSNGIMNTFSLKNYSDGIDAYTEQRAFWIEKGEKEAYYKTTYFFMQMLYFSLDALKKGAPKEVKLRKETKKKLKQLEKECLAAGKMPKKSNLYRWMHPIKWNVRYYCGVLKNKIKRR